MTYRSLPILVLVVSACASPTQVDETTSQLAGATTVVSLTFDDTLADQVQVGDLAAARGMHVTFFINSPRLGQSGYMTLAQALALQQAGNEIGGHTLDHPHLTTLSDADARTEICNDRVALLNDGFAVTSFAYPFGDNNSAVDQIVADCNYNSGRDVGGLVTPGSCNGCPYANTIPPGDLYSLRTNDSIDSTTTLDTMELYVTQAEQHGGGYVPIVIHHVCDGCNTESVSATQLAAFMDWLAARSPATQVATVNEVIGGSVKPGVTAGQTVTPPTNLLKNPSLETDADGNQVPDCWQRGGYGTNTGTYSLTSSAFDGNVAQTITVSSWSSGARRLVSAQDSGTCAPSATPGHSYTMSAYYKATTAPKFTVYYRNSSGSWVYWTESPSLPTSSSYVKATFTTPALPSGATAISLGLGIFNTGTITMDAYTLADASAPPPPSDTTPPTLSIACNGTTCATSAYSSAVTVALSATDAGSGVKEIRYTTDGSDPTTGILYTSPFTVSTTSTVRSTAVDNAGNRTTQSTAITIQGSPPPDTTPPTLSIACNGAACATTAYASAVTVSLSATDSGSGVQEIRYTTDGSDPTTGILYTSPFTVSTTSTVRATAVDNAGNRTTQSTTITIQGSPPPPDTTPPTLAIACNGAACATTAYSSAVTVSLSASDAGSGIAEVRYTTDGSDPTTGTLYTAPFTVSATSTVRATAVDNAGNRTTQSVTITIQSAPPPPSNLLRNPSLEVDANGDQVPDCWKRGGYGTNTATFTLVSDAFDGNVAQRIDITSWSSGGRRLVSAQDTGACAPAATPGHSYTMTAYYKSNVQPKFTVYYRNSSGTWSYLAESPSLPASSTYRQATYTSPPLPSGATAISIGLSIFSVGSLTSDAYTLVDATP